MTRAEGAKIDADAPRGSQSLAPTQVQCYLAIFEYTQKYGYDPPENGDVLERLKAARHILDAHGSAPGVSDKTRTLLEEDIMNKRVEGAIFSRCKGEVIAALARKHLGDFVELQESKFNVAGDFLGQPKTPAPANASDGDGEAAGRLALSEEARTHFAQDSKSLLKEMTEARRPSLEDVQDFIQKTPEPSMRRSFLFKDKLKPKPSETRPEAKVDKKG